MRLCDLKELLITAAGDDVALSPDRPIICNLDDLYIKVTQGTKRINIGWAALMDAAGFKELPYVYFLYELTLSSSPQMMFPFTI